MAGTARRIRICLGVAVAGAALLAAGCSGVTGDEPSEEVTQDLNEAGVPAGSAPKEVSLLIRSDIDTFDPHTSVNEAGAQQFFGAVYDTLIKLASDGPDGGVLPGLATEWTSTPDSASFTLHDDLTCGDGTPLTASGIARSIERLGDPETGAIFASRIFGPGGLQSVDANDEAGELTINVSQPYGYLVEGMADAFIVCPDALDDPEELAQTPSGAGPYLLASSQRGESYELTRRDDYAALPEGMELDQFPEELTLRVVKDDSTRANLLQTGEATIGSVLGQDVERLRGLPGLSEVAGPGFGASALLFNQNPGALGTDEMVREALSLAVDSEEYTQAASFGVSKPLATLYSPNMACYDEANAEATPGTDLDRARDLLAEAGWTEDADGRLAKNGKPLVVRILGYDAQNNGPEFLAGALEELGVEVKVTDTTFEGALEVLFGTGEWDVFVFPYTAELWVPSLMVSQISGDPATTLNVGNVQNDTYLDAATRASAEVGDAACPEWAKAERALLEANDVKPLSWDNAVWFGNEVAFQAQFWVVDLRTIRTAE